MTQNGLELSREKTHMILFSNCQEPRMLPRIFIDKEDIKYVNEVKFLGVFVTKKLKWKRHIDYIIGKAIKSYNLLKIVSRKAWGQHYNSFTLIFSFSQV